MKKLNADTLKLIEAIGHFIHEVEDELNTIVWSNMRIKEHLEDMPFDTAIKVENCTKKIEWRIDHIRSEVKKLKTASHEILFREEI
jgi:hypothetical protein